MKTFEDLWDELHTRSVSADSNTFALLQKGVHEIGKKIVEEAAEVWMAAEHESDDALALEISQLIYHLQVIALSRGLTLGSIYEKL
jgi:phosphoribosyl-ATP pyrophosphohydrolase